MRKIILTGVALLLLLNTSCSDENLDSTETIITSDNSGAQQQNPLSVEEINQIIKEEIELKGDFKWNSASDLMLWSALMHGDNVLTIGYGVDKSDFMNKTTASQESSKESILNVIKINEAGNTSNKAEDILIHDDKILTVIDVIVDKMETIKQLRKKKDIRYMEPSGYRYFQNTERKSLSSSGCGTEGENLNPSDYVSITPNSKMPWNFSYHNINNAWNYSTGSGITVGVIDTGASTSQSMLNGNLNNGYSSGRTIERYGVYVDSFWPWSKKTDGTNDKCGHGTSMSAIVGAPRNDKGLPVGVAYNSNLVVYRAASNVVLDGYHEQKGVARAFTEMANRSDVKIISMSMGHIFSVGRIEDAIKYAYNKGKLIFCAGGTSTSFTSFVGVIFPASMSQTVAVTGLQESSVYSECDVCHTGSEIDFTILMERSNNQHIPVLGYYDNETDYVGGSSVATATAAGIAALVWSKNPGWSRSDVLNKLITSSHLYPNKHGSFGWGVMDALKAVQ